MHNITEVTGFFAGYGCCQQPNLEIFLIPISNRESSHPFSENRQQAGFIVKYKFINIPKRTNSICFKQKFFDHKITIGWNRSTSIRCTPTYNKTSQIFILSSHPYYFRRGARSTYSLS